MQNTGLRTLVNAVDTEMNALPKGTVLAGAWTALVKELALGAEPVMRKCPACQAVGMAAATRCGNCWIALTPAAHG
jgi:hypothetical protein